MVIPKKLKTGFFEKKSKQLPQFCHVKEEKKQKKTQITSIRNEKTCTIDFMRHWKTLKGIL